jgi:glutamate synthase domain-containing protein 3
MAPTTEHDFAMLPDEKRELYRAVQRAHIHASPDGPWFFIVARSKADEDRFELLGITDTSMLRPQVFALYENEGTQIGLIASERQAINACMRSLASEDERFKPLADKYWNARGGSHTDGGAFRFTVNQGVLTCANKFGQPVTLMPDRAHAPKDAQPERASQTFRDDWANSMNHAYDDGGSLTAWDSIKPQLSVRGWDELAWGFKWLADFSRNGANEWHFAREALTFVRDRRVDTGDKKRASVLTLVDQSLYGLFGESADGVFRLTWDTRRTLAAPSSPEANLVIDAFGFPAEGDESVARCLVNAHKMGWKHFIVYNWRGGRFAAVGFGANTQGVRVDLYGDVGDYAASGLDGAEVHIHGDGQDQLGQIMKDGKLVIHGDVGQTFLYGAKGGEIYVLGSAAGRPLINAVGKPRAVINGTCLDYLAESFMAGDPYKGGGFIILNGVGYTEDGKLVDLSSPYPGGNLFSLASGGAIYIRDPRRLVEEDQLNGGVFADLTEADWGLIEPYLAENEKLFGIKIQDLLTVEGIRKSPAEIYRKVGVYTAETVLAETDNR